ncbi:hypothetical protein L2E82_35560 [Cichorium intybus]|uniref:Uncharacterized protein n=1 Tax=Cichorium intybus TaxID=13427 RepID=A0ACB9BP89_CICIN|nr:hypothetical protein L2E82_35560 [Cichorium intybus]
MKSRGFRLRFPWFSVFNNRRPSRTTPSFHDSIALLRSRNCIHICLYTVAWSSWVVYVAAMCQILAVFAGPSLRSIVSKQVGPTKEGKAQGCITGLCSFATIISALIFSPLTDYKKKQVITFNCSKNKDFEGKMSSFSITRKKTPFQKQREEEKAKKKRAKDKIAQLYVEFLESFQGDDGPGLKAFVRGGTVNDEKVKPDTDLKNEVDEK